MANELKGNECLFKIEDPVNPGTYDEMEGVTTNSMTMNGAPVEITSKGSQGFRQILDGAGVNSIDMSVEGYGADSAIFKRVLQAWNSKAHLKCSFEMKFGAENVLTVQGYFKIASLEWSAEQNNAVGYTMTLNNADKPDVQID